MNRMVFFIAGIAALAGLLFGYDTGNIAGALIFIKQEFHTSTFTNELIVAITVLGAFLSAFFSSWLVDWYGRRQLLLWAGALFVVGAIWGATTANTADLIAARFILGIAIGISSYTAPLYISEIAPPAHRGLLVLLNGVAITSGEAVAYLVDYFFAPTQNWRMMIFVGCIPGLMLLTGMFFMPCSPRWLILKHKYQAAISALQKIRGNENVQHELHEIQKAATTPTVGLKLLLQKKYYRVLTIGIGLGIFQQFFGINTIMYYGPFIFAKAGFHTTTGTILATFGLGIVNVIMTIITGFTVDRYGRRTLLLLGSFLAGFSLLIVSWLFHTSMQQVWQSELLLFFMVTYIIGYCMSVGSLFWLIIAEIFPLAARSAAMGLATAIQWSANFIVSISFLSLLNHSGASLTFSYYALMCFLALLFTYFLIPETKGLSLETLENTLISEDEPNLTALEKTQ